MATTRLRIGSLVFGNDFRHREWFLAKAESSPFELFNPDHVTWLADELDNLRSALRWTSEQSHTLQFREGKWEAVCGRTASTA